MAEVIFNLVENAAKYSPPDTPFKLSASSHGDRVFVSVSGEGPGIPEDMRDAVFGKFVRIEGERSYGLGLGLAIARGIIESQGGTIQIRSGDNGKGTKILIMLPNGEE